MTFNNLIYLMLSEMMFESISLGFFCRGGIFLSLHFIVAKTPITYALSLGMELVVAHIVNLFSYQRNLFEASVFVMLVLVVEE